MGRLTRSVSGSVERGRDRQGATDRCRSISRRVGTLLPGHLARKPGSTRTRLFGSTRRPTFRPARQFRNVGTPILGLLQRPQRSAYSRDCASHRIERNAREIGGSLFIGIDTHFPQRLHSQRRFMTSSVVAVHAVSPASRGGCWPQGTPLTKRNAGSGRGYRPGKARRSCPHLAVRRAQSGSSLRSRTVAG